MMSEEILFEQVGQIGLITLNRPSALNALSMSMLLAMQSQLQEWKTDDGVKAVVLRSSSANAFCAGGDVRWVYNAGKVQDADQSRFFWHEYRLNHFIHEFGKPYISLLDGLTMGGGVGISLHGSHPVASEHFVFAMPETGIGFFPDIGASFLLNRCPGALGNYLGLTGNRLGPQDAKKAGLVKALVPSNHMPDLLQDLINEEWSQEPHDCVDACLAKYTELYAFEEKSLINPAIDSCFSKQTVEWIRDALETVEGRWAIGVDSILNAKSPLSLKVTLAQLQKAKGLSLADCLKMDYGLVKHFLADNDFYEGIRALLIDKDKTPHWQPSRLELVKDEVVAGYFECGAEGLELID